MSAQLELTARELKVGLLKLALFIAMLILLVAWAVSWLAGEGQDLAVAVLLVSFAFLAVTNGVLAILKTIDWFEARKRKNG